MSSSEQPDPPLSPQLAALFSGDNGAYVEALFEDHRLGQPVPETWSEIFEPLAPRGGAAPSGTPSNGRDGSGAESDRAADAVPADPEKVPTVGILALIDAYRTHGHLIARLDPIERGETRHPLLEPDQFGIEPYLDMHASFGSYAGLDEGSVRELIFNLRLTYCGTFAVEFMDLRDKLRRDWLIERMEANANQPDLDPERRRRVFSQVHAAESFEVFLHKRFLGQKRFSLEGGEALIPLLDTLIEDGADHGVEEFVIAMAHRGRLNVLAHTLGMPYDAIMAGFQKSLVPSDAQGSGDVKYHRGFSADHVTTSGRRVHLSLQPNPSHLEWVNPVAEGIVRAKQNLRGDRERQSVVPLIIHGDSAFTGQGIVPETLALSELDNYSTGGTVHVIVNNQIAFTAEPSDYRFTKHPSDMAKVIQAPIFHVNADDPEACVHAARLAIAFRQTFREDVIIDLVCYRRHGHNEGDDPGFTQPLLYRQIAEHPRVVELYTKRLRQEHALDESARGEIVEAQERRLEAGYQDSLVQHRVEGTEAYRGLWSGLDSVEGHQEYPTAVPDSTLRELADALVDYPEGFTPNPKLERMLSERRDAVHAGGPLDWGTAEALALGSLLREGTTVRLTGQDAERGTFSHRHAVLHDIETGAVFLPLAAQARDANLSICNSMLSEAAVLGFEYGYSTVDPRRLAIWEAQFGDFANSAQVIVDQFVASGEKKWEKASGLVMLLPHGYEGQGPEHSSARLERFLQLSAEDNWQVCCLTTPANLFHALRRQVSRNFRKPLVLMSPKSLLRHPRAVSRLDELSGGGFRPVIGDPLFRGRATCRRVLLCSGKVYYTLLAAREDSGFDDVALVRIEQLHPFPFTEVRAMLDGLPARDVAWVQEEPWNMGAWAYVQDRIERILPEGMTLRYVGRKEAASPATGSFRIHQEEEADFVHEAFARRHRVPREAG
ncbi:MAG: 2-oxoglutarate dehydrogenase E1 component [Proteobacteria bacterium]|nr:2-oxoglutarate dehydrogenase E1 component [Pseudomonadota bacterium]